MFPVWITGNLTKDPELKPTNAGTMLVRFSVATNKRVRDKDTGEWSNGPASFWDCVAWADLAEQIAESDLRKGSAVLLYGEEEQQRYTGSDGQERTGVQITVRSIGPDLSKAKRKTQARQESSFGGEVPF
jgi:single-strand DNA-binding protein